MNSVLMRNLQTMLSRSSDYYFKGKDEHSLRVGGTEVSKEIDPIIRDSRLKLSSSRTAKAISTL